MGMSIEQSFEKAVAEVDIEATLIVIKKLIKKEGWKSVLSKVRKHLNRVVGKAWFARNWFLLSLIDSVGLMGIDKDVEKILARLDDAKDYSTIQAQAAKKLTRAVRKQLRSGGSTLFFDLNMMKKERSAVLIEEVFRARQKELIHTDRSELRYTHHGILIEYASWENDAPSYFGDETIRWGLADVEVASEIIDKAISKFGEDRIAELLAESHTQTMSERMRSIIDALYATPDGENDFWWRGWESGGEENLKPLVYSGILDSVKVLRGDQKCWRGIPSSLKKYFHTFNASATIPFALTFLLELDPPEVSNLFANTMKKIRALDSGATQIIEGMKDRTIEEYVDVLVDFIVNSDWGDSGEYGPIVPDSVHAASKAIEKKAHLITEKQRKRIRNSAFRQLHRWYTAGSVYDVNKLVLRTQGPDAVDFAKEAIISQFDWETIADDYFIDSNMVEFLRSKKIDPIPVLVNRALQDLYDEWPGLGYMTKVAEFSNEAADAVRKELINANLSNIFWEDINDFFKELSELLGTTAPYAVLGELILENVNPSLLSTIEPSSFDWNLVTSYDSFFKDDDWNKQYTRDIVQVLIAGSNPTEINKELQRVLEQDHVKPRSGAAFIIIIHEIKDEKIKQILAKLKTKHKNEPLLELALGLG